MIALNSLYVRNVREKSNNKNIMAAPSSAPTYAEIVKGRSFKKQKQAQQQDKQYSLNIINPDH